MENSKSNRRVLIRLNLPVRHGNDMAHLYPLIVHNFCAQENASTGNCLGKHQINEE